MYCFNRNVTGTRFNRSVTPWGEVKPAQRRGGERSEPPRSAAGLTSPPPAAAGNVALHALLFLPRKACTSPMSPSCLYRFHIRRA
jgi:hypothetical protein